jgi:hypothetical protein
MNYMTHVSPADRNLGYADFYCGVRENGTAMVFSIKELCDNVENDVVALLICGFAFDANMPEYVGMTNEEYIALNPAAPETVEAEYWSDEKIGEQQMLHGVEAVDEYDWWEDYESD